MWQIGGRGEADDEGNGEEEGEHEDRWGGGGGNRKRRTVRVVRWLLLPTDAQHGVPRDVNERGHCDVLRVRLQVLLRDDPVDDHLLWCGQEPLLIRRQALDVPVCVCVCACERQKRINEKRFDTTQRRKDAHTHDFITAVKRRPHDGRGRGAALAHAVYQKVQYGIAMAI